MKQTQKGKKKATNQKQAQNTEDISGFSFAMGEMDLIFTITFTDKDLEKPEGEGEDKYYKIEDMSSIKDLQFLKDKDEEFIGRIKMRPNNEFTKQLLLGNKISKKKCFIDFITFGRPKFEGEEEFFDTIFNQVTLKNGLQINSTPLEEGRFSLVIELKYKDKEQKIQLGTTPAEEEAQKKEEEEKKGKKKKNKENKKKNKKNKKWKKRNKKKLKNIKKREKKKKEKKKKVNLQMKKIKKKINRKNKIMKNKMKTIMKKKRRMKIMRKTKRRRMKKKKKRIMNQMRQ